MNAIALMPSPLLSWLGHQNHPPCYPMGSTKRGREKRNSTKMQWSSPVQMLYTSCLLYASWQPEKLSSNSIYFFIFIRVIFPNRKLKLPSQVAELRGPALPRSKAQALTTPPHGTWCLHSWSPRSVLTASARGFLYTMRVSPPYLGVLSWWEHPVYPGHVFLFCAVENTSHLSRITHMSHELWG